MFNDILKIVVEKGRICQWLAIVGAVVVGVWGGVGGWLVGEEIVKIVLAGIGVAGAVEGFKMLKGIE